MKPANVAALHYLPDMGRNIATVDLQTGIVYLNQQVFPTLPKDFQQFILLHESGHLVNNSQDDFLADKYAYQEFIKKGFRPSRAAQALQAILPNWRQDPTQKLRVQLLINRAQRHYQKHI